MRGRRLPSRRCYPRAADQRIAGQRVATDRHAPALPEHAEVGSLLAIDEHDGLSIAEETSRAGFIGGAHTGAAAPGGERLASTCRTRRQKLQSVPYAGMPHFPAHLRLLVLHRGEGRLAAAEELLHDACFVPGLACSRRLSTSL